MIAAADEVSIEAALAHYFECVDGGESIDEVSLISKFPKHAAGLQAFFADQRQLNAKVRQLSSKRSESNRLSIRCPNCHQPTEVAVDSTLTDLKCSACGSCFSLIDHTASTIDSPSMLKMGRFHLVERLGMGAFGSVWKARDDALDRIVAIKIPRQSGMTPDEQEKFFREARAAAQLQHPNIVSVHEVGRDRESVYIVSDFVPGVTLADWLTGQQPTNREAAELCTTIADALEHAHEKGVVHRDLKPANIMIDGDGAPHLMDFGLARRDAGEVTMTMDGHVLGTPAYMSPEQAEGKAHSADRRSDVYSLGVILFQLLTGELPFRGNARMLMHQMIHDEPPSPRKLNGNISRDMETVTLKCLEKDPARRYQSAKALADELRSFLAGRSIQARPIGRPERAARWVRRNKVVSALASAVLVALLAGASFSTYFAIDARARANEALLAKNDSEMARSNAESRQKEAEAVTNFLISAFKSAHPGNSGRDVKVVDILASAAKDLDTQLPDQPQTQAALLHAMGLSWLGLGLAPNAAENFKRAFDLRVKVLGREHPDTVDTMDRLAYTLSKQGKLNESNVLYEETLTYNKKRYGEDHEQTLLNLEAIAINYRKMGRYSEAVAQLEKLVPQAERSVGEDHQVWLNAAQSLGSAYSATNQFDKAVRIHERVVKGWEKVEPTGNGALVAKAGLAAAYGYASRYEEAIDLYLKIIPLQKEKFGPDHPDTITATATLASTYRKAGRLNESIPLYEQVYKDRRRLLGDADRNTMLTMNGLVIAYTAADRFDDVKQLYEDALAAQPTNLSLLNATAWVFATSQTKELRNGKRTVELATKACELTKYSHPIILDTLAAAYAEAGDLEEAVKWSEKAVEIVKDSKDEGIRTQLQRALQRYKAQQHNAVQSQVEESPTTPAATQ